MSTEQDWFTDHLGPVEVITFTLPESGEAPWTSLLQAADSGVIHLLDVEFVRRNAPDEVEFLAAEELPAPLAQFADTNTGLVDDEDAARLLAELNDGEVAVVVVVEHLGLLHTLYEFDKAGSRFLLDASVGVDDLSAALDAAESED